jgi:hypothetical protein
VKLLAATGVTVGLSVRAIGAVSAARGSESIAVAGMGAECCSTMLGSGPACMPCRVDGRSGALALPADWRLRTALNSVRTATTNAAPPAKNPARAGFFFAGALVVSMLRATG